MRVFPFVDVAHCAYNSPEELLRIAHEHGRPGLRFIVDGTWVQNDAGLEIRLAASPKVFV